MEQPESESTTNINNDKNALWQAYLNKGGTLGNLRDMSSDQMEAMYTLGFGQFDTGHYAEALKVFRYLALLDHWNPRYFLAIGYCLYQLAQFADAIPALSYAERLDTEDPRPSLCMTECFISLKNRKLAKKALGQAVNRLNNSKGWNLERKQAKQLKHYLVVQPGRSRA